VKTSKKYAFKIEKKKIFYPANILDFSLLWLQRPAPVGSVVTCQYGVAWTYKQENVNNTNPVGSVVTCQQIFNKKKIIKLTYL
jgi:hypothetical protein